LRTDVFEADPVLHFVPVTTIPAPPEREQRLEPVRPGCSIACLEGDAGTLGLIAYDQVSGRPLALSAWHVLDEGGGIGSEIYQPGPSGDCAVASLERPFDPSILDLDVIPRNAALPERGDLVTKSGRTTGVTQGRIESVGLTLEIAYGQSKIKIGNLVTIIPETDSSDAAGVAEPGDSGAAWIACTPDGATTTTVLALHLGGDVKTPSVHYATEIVPALSKLGLRLRADS
jgi:endonuclease G